jgi:hypothetical protein
LKGEENGVGLPLQENGVGLPLQENGVGLPFGRAALARV